MMVTPSQEINHLAFAASNLGLQDHIVLSDGQARVRVYVVLPGNRTTACIWQVLNERMQDCMLTG